MTERTDRLSWRPAIEHDQLLRSDVGRVAILRLNRPGPRNALNQALLADVADALEGLDADPSVRAIVLTGGPEVFAAGADITEMADATASDMYWRPQKRRWERIGRIRTPTIAAVSGYALGGGSELAMACDMVIASERARFGQPEINLGIMPGAGGTQRLARTAGKARAMEIVLTGRHVSAEEAFTMGLITRIVPHELCLEEAIRLGETIASKPAQAVQLAKDAVSQAFEMSLASGLDYERRNFNLLFATEDQREGMAAFLKKRKPRFAGGE